MRSSTEWAPVVALIDQIAADDHLLRGVVASVRTMVLESAALTTEDIVGHTRALIFAATRALADRRGPSETELSFVEDFAATRARQGVPLESVLGAVHVSERTIWARARELAAPSGVSAELLFDVRELYDDWAEAVRSRLVVAHRAASAGPGPSAQDLDASMLRRLFEGGSAAALAASEAGLSVDRGLWVVVGHAEDAADWHRALRRQGTRAAAEGAGSSWSGSSGSGASARVVSARVDGWFWAVTSREPGGGVAGRASAGRATAGAAGVLWPSGGLGPSGGCAGPTDPEGLAAARRLASAALAAAQSMGRPGLVHVAEVATQAAMSDRSDIAAMLADHYGPAWRELGTGAEPVARAVIAWLDADRDPAAAAAQLFVHPNTVRNRLQRFTEATGIDPASAFGAADAWWLCTTWLAL